MKRGWTEALALDLDPRLWAKPEGQGRCPAHLYQLHVWAGRAWGMGSPLPAAAWRAGPEGGRGFFFSPPPFLLPFCSLIMEGIQGLMQ